MKKQIVDAVTGETTVVDMTPEEEALVSASWSEPEPEPEQES